MRSVYPSRNNLYMQYRHQRAFIFNYSKQIVEKKCFLHIGTSNYTTYFFFNDCPTKSIKTKFQSVEYFDYFSIEVSNFNKENCNWMYLLYYRANKLIKRYAILKLRLKKISIDGTFFISNNRILLVIKIINYIKSNCLQS